MHGAEATSTRDQVICWARALYANAVDRKDAAGFAAVFTPDATLRFGNAPPLAGREAIREAIAHFFTAFESLEHRSTGEWLDGDTLALEAEVTYVRHDRKVVSVVAVTIFHLTDAGSWSAGAPTADACRIYVDLAPLFAPA